LDVQPPFVVEGFQKSYGALKAVDNVSFAVGDGEIVGFCGPNGAGKTTLFDLISGLAVADQGSLVVGGVSLPPGQPEIRVQHGIARTFQLNAAFGSLSVYDNLWLALHYGRPERKAEREQIPEIAALFGISGILHDAAETISVLQSKLLMLACAFASQPYFILLDEPVAGLTDHEIEQFRETIVRTNKQYGITLLVIEHVMRFLMSISSRIIFLHEGAIEFDGKPTEFTRNRQIIATYLGETAAAILAEDMRC